MSQVLDVQTVNRQIVDITAEPMTLILLGAGLVLAAVAAIVYIALGIEQGLRDYAARRGLK